MRSTFFIIVWFFYSASLSHAQLSTHLLSKFTFNNGDLKNEKGPDHAAIYCANQTADRFGNARYAISMPGNLASYINLGTGANLKPKTGSISLWFKINHPMPNGRGVEFNPILSTRVVVDEDYNTAYYIGYDLKTKSIDVNNSLNEEKCVSIYSPDSLILREWHHLVLAYDNNFSSLYLDGALAGKALKNFESKFLEGDSVILGNIVSYKNKRFLNGSVDDIEIYNKVLTQKEVLELFNAPNPVKANFLKKWWLLFIAFPILIITILFIIRVRVKSVLKKEKEKNELLNRSLEQEIKVLKAQMSPHFIFNSLNSILQFIIIKDSEKAELYLTKFSKLIRKLLETTTYDAISLSEEIEILNRYLEIESLRFESIFIADIQANVSLNPDTIFIPHMLIQPFVENAIWHGLRTKEGTKKLQVTFELSGDEALFCTIEDNGIGRKASKNESSIKQNRSLAINFIEQRLELLSKIHKSTYFLKITDKENDLCESLGTKVEIKIPLLKHR